MQPRLAVIISISATITETRHVAFSGGNASLQGPSKPSNLLFTHSTLWLRLIFLCWTTRSIIGTFRLPFSHIAAANATSGTGGICRIFVTGVAIVVTGRIAISWAIALSTALAPFLARGLATEERFNRDRGGRNPGAGAGCTCTRQCALPVTAAWVRSAVAVFHAAVSALRHVSFFSAGAAVVGAHEALPLTAARLLVAVAVARADAVRRIAHVSLQ